MNRRRLMKSVGGIPKGALPGKFTVNTDGKQVYFSKGNLVKGAGTTSSAHFWSKQSDITGECDYTDDDLEYAQIELFGWGTGDDITKISATNSDYADYREWGESTYIQKNIGTGWRTLSKDEWDYLLGTGQGNTRTTKTNILFAKATIYDQYGNEHNGVILLPDDWDGSYYSLKSVNTRNSQFSNNQINYNDWANKLEAHGAVFLPAAGKRYNTSVYDVGSGGYYWSSTGSGTKYAYYVKFDSSSIGTSSIQRYYGCNVRLVHDVTGGVN